MKAGRALDALVAEKVMRWNKRKLYDDVAGPEWYWCDGYTGVQPVDSWNPSERIHYAWLVVEKMRNSGSNVWVGFYGDKWHMHFTEDGLSESPADTAPLAICLAALKAVGVEVTK